MLHRYRHAMVDPSRDKLTGTVEVDETYVGGTDKGSSRAPSLTSKKAIVAIAVELEQPKGFGRIRLKRIEEATQKTLNQFVHDNVEQGTVIRTDGASIYRTLPTLGYSWDKHVLLGSNEPAHETLVGVHRVASLVKRWLLGTHQGSVNLEHLDAYLNEYAFRFNRRKSRSRGLLFFRLLELAVHTPPIKYKDVKIK